MKYKKNKLIDKSLSNPKPHDEEINKLWIEESENRIDAYEKGKIKAVTLEKVLERYK